MQNLKVQACLRDTAGLVLHHHNIEYYNKARHNVFVGGESCLRFVKNATSVKPNKVKHTKMGYACTGRGLRYCCKQFLRRRLSQ